MISHTTPPTPDQRQEYRLCAAETVYLELEAEQDHERAKIVISRSTDLSANGLQVELDRPLPPGHIYPLCVQLQNPEVRFVLTGEVKWCRSAAAATRWVSPYLNLTTRRFRPGRKK